MAKKKLRYVDRKNLARFKELQDAETDIKLSNKVSDVEIGGLSIVNKGVAGLTLGPGLGIVEAEVVGPTLTLSTVGLQEVVPKGLTLGEQEGIRLFAEKDGVPSYVSASNLDYSKMSVMDEENLNEVRTNDFLFLKEK